MVCSTVSQVPDETKFRIEILLSEEERNNECEETICGVSILCASELDLVVTRVCFKWPVHVCVYRHGIHVVCTSSMFHCCEV